VHSGENIQELAIASNTYTANKQQNRYKDNKEMKGRLVRAWDVLDKYYSKTDEVIYYAAALILNPSYHVGYIKKNWPLSGVHLKHWKRHGILEQKVLDLGEDGEVRCRGKRAKNSEKGNATLASTSGAGPYD
jgi:hypothetical protein